MGNKRREKWSVIKGLLDREPKAKMKGHNKNEVTVTVVWFNYT
jgi:hypothetical protein